MKSLKRLPGCRRLPVRGKRPRLDRVSPRLPARDLLRSGRLRAIRNSQIRSKVRLLRPSLQSKISGLRVTEKSIEYEGSLGVGEKVLKAAGLKPGQLILVINTENGERFETYLIKEPEGVCSLRGGAARLGEIGDELIVMAFVWLEAEEELDPRIIKVDKNNNLTGSL
ncbi:hypothetical protein GF359_10495 [candidate division WOR-3 bacterium]|uniref:Aspartate 1-decarboxylase n=1 Tax=candidate division WOR-3 bacterium TaxID=2052148 RepID=A0A9D5KBE0_UNCW3|nr:hypothetical protein [candidate division WOR-3 bacterium]MBD3365630.1 hypothetical protein [candidate division WOR-3 bacterium]